MREELAMNALQDLIRYLKEEGGQVGIFDAANITMERRRLVHEKLSQHQIQVRALFKTMPPSCGSSIMMALLQVIFLEVICDVPEAIESNLRHAVMYSPEYIGVSSESALADMYTRLSFYEPYYQSLGSLAAEESEESKAYSYIQIYNVNEAFITNHIHGTLPTRMAFYLMNMHVATKFILFFKESDHMKLGVLESLLEAFLAHQAESSDALKRLEIWTSTYPPSIQLSKNLVASNCPYAKILSEPIAKSQISRLESPEHLSLSSEQIQALYPAEYSQYLVDPYNTRLSSQSESYADLSIRLESPLIELEGKPSSLLIIAHESTLRCLYAYYMNTPAKDIPTIDISEDSLISLLPLAYGTVMTVYHSASPDASVTIDSPKFQYTAT